jgi:hypothetical protein
MAARSGVFFFFFFFHSNRVDDVSAGGEVGVNVLRSPLDVAFNVHSVTWGSWNGETEVEGDRART